MVEAATAFAQYLSTRPSVGETNQDLAQATIAKLEAVFDLKLAGRHAPLPPRRTSSLLRKSSSIRGLERSVFREDALDWGDALRSHEFTVLFLLALLLGKAWDLLTSKQQARLVPASRKKIFVNGELVEHRDRWTDWYPETNCRWLASAYSWAVLCAALLLLYAFFKVF